MSKLIISGIGPDQAGIVASIASILYGHGCSIEDSTMTRLVEQFAFIMLVNAPKTLNFHDLQKEFSILEDSHNLVILLKMVPNTLSLTSYNLKNLYMVSVSGHDKMGITLEVTRRLAEMDINITDLNSQTIDGENGPVYLMMLEVDIPDSISAKTVKEELQILAKKIHVEVQVRPLESVAL